MTNDELKLHLGEMSASELRVAKAAYDLAIRAALTPAPAGGDIAVSGVFLDLEAARLVNAALGFLRPEKYTQEVREPLEQVISAFKAQLAEAESGAQSVAIPATPESPMTEAVAYRWRPRGHTRWIYDPDPEWLFAQSRDDIDYEPIFAHPPQGVNVDSDFILKAWDEFDGPNAEPNPMGEEYATKFAAFLADRLQAALEGR